jgi:hypothetical protein
MLETLKTYWAMPSTKKGLALLLGLVGVQLPMGVLDQIGQLVILGIATWETIRVERVR